MVLDLTTMLTAIETGEHFISMLCVCVAIVTFAIGSVRSLGHALTYASLSLIVLGILFYPVNSSIVILGFMSLAVTMVLLYFIVDKEIYKTGGAA